MQNIIGAGINVYADTGQAENALISLGRRQTDLLRNSRLFAREYPRNLDRAINPMQKFGEIMDRNYTSIQRFNYEIRHLTNQLNSLVMAGVAVSMTGVSFMNFGRTVTNAFVTAIEQATAFEKTMKEIEFLGGLKGQVKEMKEIEQEIMKIGVSLPTTNQKVAEGMVEAMRAGFSKDEAIKLAPIMSEMAFLSFEKMTEEDSLKMMNTWLKTTARNVDDAREAFDKFAKTADIFTTDMDGINRSFQSTRAAFDTLQLGSQELGEESFLTLIGMMSTQYNPRAGGMMINSFSRGLAQAFGTDPGTKRGDLWRALGIDYEAEDDILKTMDKISQRSIELWGDTKERQEKLIDLFGVEGLPVLQMLEKYKESGEDIYALRDSIRDSAGYSKEYMEHIMKTSYGTQQILKGTKETLVTLIGLSILEPVNKVLWGLSRALAKIAEFAQEHPQLTKFVSLLVLSTGVLSMVAGGALLVGGAFMAMYGSIATAIVTLGQLNASQDMLDRGFTNLGSILRHGMITPMKTAVFGMAKMAIASGLLYLAWKHDFMGMRTQANRFFESFRQGRKLAEDLFLDPKMSWDQYLQIKQRKDPITAWFADKFVKARALGMLIKGLWDDNIITADEVGGEAEFRRLYKIWEESGMLEIADTILDWRDNIKAFWEGFQKGGEIARNIVLPVFQFIGDVLVWMYDRAVDILGIFGFMKEDATDLKPAFEKMGTVLGTIVGIAGGIVLAFKAWRITLGPIVSLLSKAAGFALRMGGKGMGFLGFGRNRNNPNGGGPNGGNRNNQTRRQQFGDTVRRTVARGLLLDRAFPTIFGRDGSVRNPANAPTPTSRIERRRQTGHMWAWNRTRNTYNPMSLDRLPQYGSFTQRGNRGPVQGQDGVRMRTLNSKTFGGILRDVMFGRRVDVTQNKNGGYSYRQINQHGQAVSRNVKAENLRMNRRGEVRTGRGLLTGNIFYQGGSAVARRVGRTQMAQNARIGMEMYRQQIANTPLVRNVRRQGAVRRYDTTGVAGARPGQQHIVRERGGFIGGTMDTMFGSRTYNRDGQYVGRTRQNAQGQRSFRRQGRAGRAMSGMSNILGGLFNAIKTQGPKAGKLLGKVIMAPLKIGFRAIPIVGQLLLAWDIISMVWGNWDKIKAGAAVAWEWIKTTGINVWNWFTGTAIPGMWEFLKSAGGLAWEAIKLVGNTVWDFLKSAGEKIWDAITGFVKNKVEEWKTTLSGMWDAMKTAFEKVWNGIVDFAKKNPVTRAINWVAEKLPGGGDPKGKGHRTGLYNVGRENYPALLHRGEMVLTQREAQVLRAMSGTRSIYDTLMDAKDSTSGIGMRTGGTVTGNQSIKAIEPKVVEVQDSGGRGSVSINFGKVEIHVQNMTDPKEIEKGAKQMFEKFKRMVELENTRNYRPARAR